MMEQRYIKERLNFLQNKAEKIKRQFERELLEISEEAFHLNQKLKEITN